jgi:mRNA-degrading endonuclease toxin of MazEF toxin-antitoxin module
VNKFNIFDEVKIRGEIYNALITENIGSEINDNHLIVVISNERTNIYADKINVLPIEGDGAVVPNYLEQLTNNDLEYGHLDKNPSRVIIPEILTIDKARLEHRIGKIKKEKIDQISKKILKQLSL